MYYFNNERDRLINQQIETHASLLLSSGLSNAQLEDFEEAEGIITNILGGSRINQVIVIYAKSGKVIYRNKNASLIKLEAPFVDTWTNLKLDDHMVRLLTVPFTARKRVLQIGIVLNESLDNWVFFTQRVWVYIALIMACTLIISFVMTTLLLRPFKKLAAYLRHLTQQFESDVTEVTLPAPIVLAAQKKRSPDEFSQLTISIYELMEKIKSVFKQTHSRSAQLAHELKTPLTIIRNQLESLQKSLKDKDQVRVTECLEETDHLSKTIQDFLEWSVAENTPGAPEDIHVIHLQQFLTDFTHSLEPLYPQRIQLELKNPATVFCKREHLDQLLNNLVINSLKYSQKQIQVRVDDKKIQIEDLGPGLSPKVMERMGLPFNIGGSKSESTVRGSGLGLAWVQTLCNKYGWKIKFENQNPGLLVSLDLSTEAS